MELSHQPFLPGGLLGNTGLDAMGESGFYLADGAQASPAVLHSLRMSWGRRNVTPTEGLALHRGSGLSISGRRQVPWTHPDPSADPAQWGIGLVNSGDLSGSVISGCGYEHKARKLPPHYSTWWSWRPFDHCLWDRSAVWFAVHHSKSYKQI